MTRRTLNVKLLAWTAGALVVVGLAAWLVNTWQVRRAAHSLLDSADRAVTADKFDQAERLYTQYLTFVPGDVDAREKYARLLDRRARTHAHRLGLVVLLQQVLAQKPELDDLRLRLVHNLVLVDRTSDAIQHLQTLVTRKPADAEVHHMLGWCQEARGKYAEAVKSFKEAARLDAARVESHTLLAETLHHRLGQTDEARQVLAGLVSANPTDPRAYLVRARFALLVQEAAAADDDVKTALALAPDRPDVVLFAARRSQAKGMDAEAQDLLASGLKANPKEVSLYRALADAQARAGKRDEAAQTLAAGLEQVPGSHELHVLLTDLLIDRGKLDDAAARLEALRKDGGDPGLTAYLQGRLVVERKRWSAAVPLLEKARSGLAPKSEWQPRVDTLLGLCWQRCGDAAKAAAAYRRALGADADLTPARVGLGEALLALGRPEDAATELRRARAAGDAPSGVSALLGRALLNENLRRPPERRDWAEVESLLGSAPPPADDPAPLAVLRAGLAAARGDLAGAAATLDKELATRPETAALWASRAELAALQGDRDGALRMLDDAQKKLGDRVELRLARARVFASRGTAEDRDHLRALVYDTGPLSPDDTARLRRELGEVWYRLGEWDEAAKLWQQAARDNPHDAVSRGKLLDVALQTGRTDVARTLVAELRESEGPQGTQWRYGRAALLVHESRGEREKLKEARRVLRELGRDAADLGRVALLEAKIEELQGNYAGAVGHYARAVELGEVQPRFVARVLRLLLEREDFLRAEEVVQQAQRHGPLGPELSRLAAEVALGNRNTSAAVGRARQAVTLPARDELDALWLAGVLDAAGETADAEKVLRAAVGSAGRSPEPWVALAEHLSRNDRKDAARAVLDEMKAKLPADRLPLALARAHEALHDAARAGEVLCEALAARPNDFSLLRASADLHLRQDEPEKAEPHLRRLLDAKVAAPAEHQARARRALAVILAGRGPSGRDEAKELLAAGPTLADERTRLFVIGSDPGERARAIGTFEESLRKLPPSPGERLLLAELYAAAGKLSQARDELRLLVSRDPHSPQYLARYVRVLLRSDDPEAAAEFLARLEKLEPDSARTRQLRETLTQAVER